MRILNLGFLAHVDAGKTTLTERLLYATGVIDDLGSVDEGSTQTDFLPLERQRGITIRSAVASFAIGEVTVNLIDTPGHPDFIAEVERILSVLDGAVLLISAVEGVQVQTRILMRALQRLGIPMLIFINKIDRAGADDERVVQEVSQKLTPAIISMGKAGRLGTSTASFMPYSAGDAAFSERLTDTLADHDDEFLAAYANGETAASDHRLHAGLAKLTKHARVHPVFFGSALTGAGVDTLMTGIKELLPAHEGDPEGQVRGSVFKVERGPAREKIAYVRMFSGTVRTRDQLRFGPERDGKVTGLAVFDRGPATQSPCVSAGQIAKLWGLSQVQIGDRIGAAADAADRHYFGPPTLETAVVPRCSRDKPRLHLALSQLAEQDPLINLRQDDLQQEMYVSLYGEVQKEVIQATLALEFDVEAEFRESSPIYVERPVGAGQAVERLGKGSPFLATVGLQIEPGPVGSGLEFRLEADLVSIPLYVFKSVDEFRGAMTENVRDTLAQGLHGWQVTDCLVIMWASGYAAPSTKARDFRLLTPLVLMAALEEAGTTVCEPVNCFEMEIPAETFPAVMSILGRLGAVLRSSDTREMTYVLEGEIPAAKVHELRLLLPATTRGEGVLECEFAYYRPVSDDHLPSRFRSDLNPLNRAEYLSRLAKRF